MSITRKTDGNFGSFRGCFVFQSRVSTKTGVILFLASHLHDINSKNLFSVTVKRNYHIDFAAFKIYGVNVHFRPRKTGKSG